MWTAKKKEILEALKPIIEKAYPLMQQHGLKDITAYYNGSGDDFNGADFNFETNKGHVLSKEASNHIDADILPQKKTKKPTSFK